MLKKNCVANGIIEKVKDRRYMQVRYKGLLSRIYKEL